MHEDSNDDHDYLLKKRLSVLEGNSSEQQEMMKKIEDSIEEPAKPASTDPKKK